MVIEDDFVMTTNTADDPEHTSKIHPAAPYIALFVAVAVGRLQEIFPVFNPLQLGKVTLVAAVAAVLFSKMATNKMYSSLLGRRLIWFCTLAVVSVAYSIWGTQTLSFLEKDILRIFLLFVLIYKTSVNVSTLRFYILVVAGILLLMALVGVTALSSARTAFSDTYDANDIGLVVLTTSAFLCGVSRDRDLVLRKFLLALSLVGFAVVLSTQSRGAFLGLCAVGIYFAFAKDEPGAARLYRMPTINMMMAFAIGILVIILIAPAESWDRILTLFNLESDYNTSEDRGRIAIWTRGLESFLSQPWGVGGGAYQEADMRAGGDFMTAHNSFIQVAVELGVVGLLLYVGFYKSAWQQTGKMLRVEAKPNLRPSMIAPAAFGLGMRASMIGFGVCGFFLSMAYGRIFYVLLALVAAGNTLWFGDSKVSAAMKKRVKHASVPSGSVD